MIPRVVHYFWFSGEEMPALLRSCLATWEKCLPGYVLRKWDLTTVEVDCEFARQALAQRRWAFLTDYFRMKAVHDHGGVYLDTDVYLVRPLDDLLAHPSFWGFADTALVEPVVFGAHAGNPVLSDILAAYRGMRPEDIDLDTYNGPTTVITPIFEQRHGLQPYDAGRIQELTHAVVFPHSYFCALPFGEAGARDFLAHRQPHTYAIHLWNNGWFDEFRLLWRGRYRTGFARLAARIARNPFQPLGFYRDLLYHVRRFLREGWREGR